MNTATCKDCLHSEMRPEALEAAIPGLKILSSAYGAVRGETGLCRRHEQFVTARSTCADFEQQRNEDTKGEATFNIQRATSKDPNYGLTRLKTVLRTQQNLT